MASKTRRKGRPDWIIGGPPCQGFSTAGWRFVDDPRNRLFKHFVELVEEMQPRGFLMENVTGLLSAEKGNSIREICECFSSLGYHLFKPTVLHAVEHGVPQKRKRVFIIGVRDTSIKFSWPLPKFHNPDKCSGSLFAEQPYVTVWEAISDLPIITDDSLPPDIKVEKLPCKCAYQRLMGGEINPSEFYLQRPSELPYDQLG